MGRIDSKAASATLAAAIAGLGWFLLAKFGVGNIETWSAEELVTATGFTTTILVFVLSYAVPNVGSGLQDGTDLEPVPGGGGAEGTALPAALGTGVLGAEPGGRAGMAPPPA